MTGLLGLAGLLCLELTLDGAGGVLERAGVGDRYRGGDAAAAVFRPARSGGARCCKEGSSPIGFAFRVDSITGVYLAKNMVYLSSQIYENSKHWISVNIDIVKV